MLIFNGKKYFVPFIGKEKIEGADATPDQVVEGVKFAGANGVVEEGRMPTLALLKPKIYVSSDGEITATVTQNVDGFVKKGEQSATEWLLTQDAAVIVPSNKNQMAVSKGWFTTGDVTVAPIPDKYKDATGANALPSQVVKGAYFLGANGVVEEGKLPFYDGTDMNAGVYESDDEYAYIQSSVDKTSIIEDVVYSKVPLSKLGDVRPMWVAKGYTFTSEAGVLVDGECPIYIPSKVEPILCYSCTDTDPRFFLFTSETTTPLMIEDIIDFKVEKSEFGNATAADVRAGVRFTSAEGVNKEGTMEESGTSIDTCTVNVTFSKNAGITLISATTFENGTISVVNQPVSNNNSGRSFSIPNVVCGSALSINTEVRVGFHGSFDKYYHGFSLGGTITVPTAPGTYTVEVGEEDD